MAYPAQRLVGPTGITKGQPIKAILSPACVKLIGEAISQGAAKVGVPFNAKAFVAAGSKGINALELKERSNLIALAMRAYLPSDFAVARDVFIASLGPSGGVPGMACFYFHPFGTYLSDVAKSDPNMAVANALEANLELTQRFTAEYVPLMNGRGVQPSFVLLEHYRI